EEEGPQPGPREEVRPGGAHRDVPQPPVTDDDLQAFGDLREDGAALRSVRRRLALAYGEQGPRGKEERGRVEQHRQRRTQDLDHGARERVASGPRDRVARLEHAVRVDELPALHEDRQVRLVRDVEEYGEDADEKREHIKVEHLEDA